MKLLQTSSSDSQGIVFCTGSRHHYLFDHSLAPLSFSFRNTYVRCQGLQNASGRLFKLLPKSPASRTAWQSFSFFFFEVLQLCGSPLLRAKDHVQEKPGEQFYSYSTGSIPSWYGLCLYLDSFLWSYKPNLHEHKTYTSLTVPCFLIPNTKIKLALCLYAMHSYQLWV